jgi:hypothetical protein
VTEWTKGEKRSKNGIGLDGGAVTGTEDTQGGASLGIDWECWIWGTLRIYLRGSMQETVPNNCQTMWFSTVTAVLNGDFNPPWTRLTPSQLNQNLGGWNPVGVWTQGFALARQVLYCLSHASCPFCSSYFEIGLCFLPRPGLQSYFRHPALLGRQVVCCHTQHFHCDGVLLISSTSRVAWNLDPPDLSLLCSLRWQVLTTSPCYWLRWGLATFFAQAGLKLSSWSRVTLILFFWVSFSL